MTAQMECLGGEAWLSLLGDTLPAEQQESYERHLESCPVCQGRLDHAIESEDTMLQVGRRLGDPTRAPAEEALRQLLRRLHQARSSDEPCPADADELPFLRLGTLGAYQVEEVIGQGGMGVVLKAYEPALRRHVAIKVLAPALASSAAARKRFTREARAAAAVCHENVVAVHGVHEADGLPYLVMQYVAGESLQARLDRCGALPAEEVVRVGMQTASGLAAAHAQGLVHRDIKPANILLAEGERPRVSGPVQRPDRRADAAPLADPVVKITDFGLARMTDEVALTQNGVLVGTPEYMSPEQARGEAIDHRCDLFSLGSVLYALCTGAPPFRGSTAVAVLRQVSDREPAPLRAVNPDVPAWLEALTARLMAKDPQARFHSALEVATLLEGYLAHLRQPTTAPPSLSLPRRALPRWFRHSLILVLVLAGVLGLIRLAFLAADGGAPAPAAGTDEPLPPLRRLHGHTGPVHDVVFTRDGRLVSASSWPGGDRTIRIWDVASGKELSRIDTPGEPHSLDLTPDGRFALAGMNTGDVLYIDLGTCQIATTLKGHAAAVDWVAFDRDGKRAFSASMEGTARMWDLQQGREEARFRVDGANARAGAVFPDGRRLLTGNNKGLLQVWDLSTQKEIQRVQTGGQWMIDSLGLSADGRHARVAGVAGVRVYDLETGQEGQRFQAEHEEVFRAALSPDGQRLLTGGFDGAVRLWDYPSGQLLRMLGNHEGWAFGVAFSPDGRFAASGGGGWCKDGTCERGTDHDIRIWDLKGVSDAATTPPRVGEKHWLVAGAATLLVLALGLSGLLWYARKPRGGVGSVLAANCSGCGRTLRVRAELAGKKVRCSSCGQAVLVAR